MRVEFSARTFYIQALGRRVTLRCPVNDLACFAPVSVNARRLLACPASRA
jgi:hypothetical protein